MKKLLIALLVLVLALSLLACGDTTTDETTLPDETEPTVGPSGEHIHNYVDAVILAPTCTSLGKSAKQCSCGDILTDSEMPLPFALHDANEVSCTEDSVCKTCGKLLVEKYGHNLVETVVSVASCNTAGEITTKCSRCGVDGDKKVIPAGHSFDTNAITIAKGDVTATCTKCGTKSSLLAGTPALALTFDSAAELDALSGFKVEKVSGIKFDNGAVQPNGGLWFGYSRELVTSMSKFVVSFDFKLVEQGQTTRGESIITFVSKTPADYKWLVKFYQADGVLSTASGGFNATNSVPATQGKWYNFVAIVDVATNKATVYIDGVNIGTANVPNHNNESVSDFFIRLYDIMPGNGISNPYFDNFKLVEIK